MNKLQRCCQGMSQIHSCTFYSPSPYCLSYPSALTAMPAPAPEVSIKHIIRMTVRAMCPCHSLATNTAPHIHFVSYYLKMVRIYTQVATAQMVKFKRLWNKSASALIGKLMSHDVFSFPAYHAKMKQPVTMPILPCFPQPTFIRFPPFNFSPKPFLDTIIFHSHILPRKGEVCQWA